MDIVAIADVERSVGIFVVQIVGAGTVLGQIHLIVLTIPMDTVDAHRGVRHVEHFELVILVAAIEDELATVVPLHTVVGIEVGWHVGAYIKVLIVLHHYGVYLLLGTGYGKLAEVDCHRHLLVALAIVDIGIWRYAHA